MSIVGRFKFTKTDINDVFIIDVEPFGDERGYFMETYNENDFKKEGLNYTFVQDNQSRSFRGVLRGLHYQKEHPQTKLVRAIEGEVFDVAVDIRPNSPSFGKWVGVVLSESNKRQLLIPKGLAHGFVVLSEFATFCYKCDEFYHPNDEGGIMWNDPELNIEWPIKDVILSDKDQKHPTFSEYKGVL